MMDGGRSQDVFLGCPCGAGAGLSGIKRRWWQLLSVMELCACLLLPSPATRAAAAGASDSAASFREETSDKGATGFSLSSANSRAPINIDAKVLEFDARRNIAVFRGDVVTTQGEVVVESAMLTVKFAQPEGADGTLSQAESVVAEGDVRITRGGRVAHGQRAEFNDAERTVVLSGGAVLNEGSSEVRGERLIVYLDENRSVVEGTNSRVKAVLIPGADGREKDPDVMSPVLVENEQETSVNPQLQPAAQAGRQARGQVGERAEGQPDEPASMVGE